MEVGGDFESERCDPPASCWMREEPMLPPLPVKNRTNRQAVPSSVAALTSADICYY